MSAAHPCHVSTFKAPKPQAVEEEQAHLTRAEARAAELAAIAAQLHTGHDGGAAAVAARKAAEAAAERRHLVEGPQALQLASAPEVLAAYPELPSVRLRCPHACTDGCAADVC